MKQRWSAIFSQANFLVVPLKVSKTAPHIFALWDLTDWWQEHSKGQRPLIQTPPVCVLCRKPIDLQSLRCPFPHSDRPQASRLKVILFLWGEISLPFSSSLFLPRLRSWVEHSGHDSSRFIFSRTCTNFVSRTTRSSTSVTLAWVHPSAEQNGI